MTVLKIIFIDIIHDHVMIMISLTIEKSIFDCYIIHNYGDDNNDDIDG